jgi:PPOX class probable F420-dependent enzyme
MDSDDMRGRVAAARVARLATLGREGAPHLVPFCFVLDGEVLYSAVDQKKKQQTLRLRRLDNVRRDPRVSVLVDHYEEDWSKLWWVRIEGEARELEPGAEAEEAVRLLTSKYEQYRERRPQGPVLRVDLERWSGWTAT